MTIQEAWGERNNLHAEGGRLCDEGLKLCADGRLCAEGFKLHAEGIKLCAEGLKLCAEGSILLFSAVIEKYGNIGMEWKNWNEKHNSYEFHLANGEVYGFEEK